MSIRIKIKNYQTFKNNIKECFLMKIFKKKELIHRMVWIKMNIKIKP